MQGAAESRKSERDNKLSFPMPAHYADPGETIVYAESALSHLSLPPRTPVSSAVVPVKS